MAEIERLVVASALMRGTKRLRLGPRLERRMIRPHGVRSIERVVLELWPAQQMEFDESRHLVEMAVARRPDLLEGGFRAFADAKAIHGDVHGWSPDAPNSISSFRDAPQGAGPESIM